jgi:hypothetical protein
MDIEKTFAAIFWTLFALMLSMRFWFGFRVWRSGERIRGKGDRLAILSSASWARGVSMV